jgi:hypothetical protein
MKQLQAAGLEAVTRWRTGRATLRDSFSYLPDGAFQIGFGGLPGMGIAGGGIGGLGGGIPGTHLSQIGSVGNIPSLANKAILDVVQAINPVSAITVAGGFSNAHFYDPTNTLINSDQVTIEGGYSHLFARHDQIGAVYAFQLLQFPQDTGGQIYIHVVNLRWSHTISGRLSLIAGAGPEYTDLEVGGYITHWSVSAQVQLHYKLGHGSMSAGYEKFTSAGSGVFAGADTQIARLSYTRPLGRMWEFYGDLGFSHDTKLQNFGVSASSHNAGVVDALVRKHMGRSYDFLASYRFGETFFNTPVKLAGSTGKSSQRQLVAVGVEWHPKPTRIE